VVTNTAAYNIVSVNMSLGDGNNFSTNQTNIISDELAFLSNNLRVTSVASAGNLFDSFNSVPGVAYPAADTSVISVGATYDANVGSQSYIEYGGAVDNTTAADRVASFSQRHATLLHIFAPGALITSAGNGGGTSTYRGTSQSAPHVAAAVALAQHMRQETTGTRLNRQELIATFQATGVSINDGDNENDNVTNTGLTFARLNIDAMADALLSPSVVDVELDGTSWSRNPYSFADIVPTRQQVAPIFTQGVNQVRVAFNEHVVLNSSALTLYGSNESNPNPEIISSIGFSYDAVNQVATWSFPTLPHDKYRIDLSTAVEDIDGNPLDGYWESITDGVPDNYVDGPTGRTLVSGNGTPNQFQFNFSYLPGDYNQDGKVNTSDGSLYSTRDGDGDGVAGGIGDLGVYSTNVGDVLPFRKAMGDYDDNEIVNVFDYSAWRSTYGNTGPNLPADGNENGAVDLADYIPWRNYATLRSAWFTGVSGGGAAIPLTLSSAAPQVLNVTMSGTSSTHDPYSFNSVDGSGEQLRTVPIGSVDTVSITFNEEVLLFETDLTLTGMQGQSVPSISDFSYDSLTQTATWQFSTPLERGQYLVRLYDEVIDLDGDALDGEFTNPWSLAEISGHASTFPSGDGTAGGDFRFRFTNLPGDFGHNNAVDTTDYLFWSSHNPTASGAPHGWGDADGDGDVDSTDYTYWSGAYGVDYTRWPSIEPGMILVSNATDESDANYSYGDLSLREALSIAASQTGPDTIEFDSSITAINLTLGQLSITSDVTIQGSGADELTIDAQGNSRVFLVDSGVDATIRGLTITGGSSNGGGGVYIFGDLTMDSVRVTGNSTSDRGGGIYVYGTLRLSSSSVDGNSAASGGGGIYVNDTAYATISLSTIDANEAYYGGGLYGYLGSGDRLEIDRSTISYNTAVGTWSIGGGMLIQSAAGSTGSNTKIVSSTIANNSAAYSGGIRLMYSANNLELVSSTVAYNAGNESGGVQNDSGTVTAVNSIIAENTNAAASADSDVYGWLASASVYNLLGRGGSGGLTGGINGNIVLSSGYSAGLASLDYYGGLTKTIALLNGSPAIDAGDDASVAAFGLLYDQRGDDRIDDGNGDSVLLADIGAFELAADEYFGDI
jgi:hypothetical protein